jgi:hypothetical protein
MVQDTMRAWIVDNDVPSGLDSQAARRYCRGGPTPDDPRREWYRATMDHGSSSGPRCLGHGINMFPWDRWAEPSDLASELGNLVPRDPLHLRPCRTDSIACGYNMVSVLLAAEAPVDVEAWVIVGRWFLGRCDILKAGHRGMLVTG